MFTLRFFNNHSEKKKSRKNPHATHIEKWVYGTTQKKITYSKNFFSYISSYFLSYFEYEGIEKVHFQRILYYLFFWADMEYNEKALTNLWSSFNTKTHSSLLYHFPHPTPSLFLSLSVRVKERQIYKLQNQPLAWHYLVISLICPMQGQPGLLR